MNWEVQITGDDADLKELSRCLTDNELRMEELNDKYFLRSIRFDNLTTPEEVTSECVDLLSLLTGSARLALGGKTPIEITNISRIRDDGVRIIFVTVSETVYARDFIDLETHRENGTVEVLHPAHKVSEWFKIGLSDAKVAKALRLYGISEYDWVSLYRLYEVIEEDIGGIKNIASRGWATKDSIKRFKHTANSPSSTGNASRHGKESTSPPVYPMELTEAKSLIELLLHSWLELKSMNINQLIVPRKAFKG